ncbi:phosphoesterase [Pochonia chlamydosporia 170]|uniref:Phosphoesterase n=1 Tax=Pochonia chlamydosporia 170 TaxID=1380566 RepID=A0A179FBP6_METCM|nr:phosphoesterase [Pochonia chlamydosporia 170]OAQ62886.1 phosphoesterase [Pochonia chlamydosporia 170]
MSSTAQPISNIKIRRSRLHNIAEALIKRHRVGCPHVLQSLEDSPIRIVCISDTHNRQPTIPPGDVLIHAGDLTENGSFDEVQAGVTWLSSQPHKYKVFVAGNHDVLLDDAFLATHPERRYGQTKTRQDLDWGDVIYLQDSVLTLEFPVERQREDAPNGSTADDPKSTRKRSITIFGSPWTPQYGTSAFQYHPNNSQHWEHVFATLKGNMDILITHGPPKLHLDRRDFHRAGCPYLAEEISRLRPRISVFGHIHASYGQENVVLDSAQRIYEEAMIGWAGWSSIVWMTVLVAWTRIKALFSRRGDNRLTTFINAAVVAGPRNELQNEPIVVDI